MHPLANRVAVSSNVEEEGLMPTEASVVAATLLRRPLLISSSSKTGVSVGARFLALRQRRYERSPPPARPESRREEAPLSMGPREGQERHR